MSHEEIFGQPTDLLVVEAVVTYRRRKGDWPLWAEAREILAEWEELSEGEAEVRLNEAVKAGEVLPVLRGGGEFWGLRVEEAVYERTVRRGMAMKLFKDQEEAT